MSEHILIERTGAVLEIRFNRPDKKNAITNAMYGAMADALEAAAKDNDVRVILFTGAGDYFTAGNDLQDFAAQGAGTFSGPRHVNRFLPAVITAEKPIVAAVRGHAVGVGTTMLLHCDLVYIANDARLTAPFVNLALLPENASSLTIPARIGHAKAFALLGLCEPMLGAEAAASGIANAALPAGEVEPRARAAATELATKPPQALKIAKRLLRSNTDALLARMREEGELFGEQLKSPEAAAAFKAFFAKK
ncbi:MAG TPA: enoyl-CoA hydratase-related protein [Vitreimonas sp.]|jgi:enoyl-CoA hydratase/carnithine racemase|nr:enoyl-CoA hydratase-related protein [Vitreimonas sp.]